MPPKNLSAPDNYLSNLSGIEFENLIIKLLRKMGFIVEETKATNDGGIDAIAINEDPITSGRFIIQCKRYSGVVGQPVVRDLYGVVTHERASKGIIITTSDFSKQAIEFAEGKPIELLNGSKLRALFRKYDLLQSSNSEENTITFAHHWHYYAKSVSSISSMIRHKIDTAELYRGLSKNILSQRKYYREFGDPLIRAFQKNILNLLKIIKESHKVFSVKKEIGTDTINEHVTIIDENVNELLRSFEFLYTTEPPSENEIIHLKLLEVIKQILIDFIRYTENLDAALSDRKFTGDSDVNGGLSIEFFSAETSRMANECAEFMNNKYSSEEIKENQNSPYSCCSVMFLFIVLFIVIIPFLCCIAISHF